MGEMLAAYGVETMTGYSPDHLDPRPDLVVVGNVCRKDNPEARAAIDGGMATAPSRRPLGELFLASRKPSSSPGTHGKTTTTALTSRCS
jgi:UDP-N-acetylmuramate: L-alanyl-gamma-D-glutamyl-meso-diaminopimelate ligase